MEKAKLTKLLNALNKTRNERLAHDRASAELKEKEQAMAAELQELMTHDGIERFSTATANATLTRRAVPSLTDEDAFRKWASKKGHEHVMGVRVVTEAWREMVAEGTTVPGVETFVRADLRVTDAKRVAK